MKNKNHPIFDYRKKKIKVNEKKIEALVKELIEKLKARKFFLGIMESCTGGGMANVITNIPGASDVFKGGIVAYSTEIKKIFGVPKELIKKYSVYSPQVALAMAKQVRKILKTDIGLSVTGSISRLDPKNIGSKVGRVDAAVIFRKKTLTRRFYFPNLKQRSAIKAMIIYQVLKMIREII